jgi:hypothetical protein
MRARSGLWVLVAALAAGLGVEAAGPRTFAVEPEQSRAIIDVGKAGAFSFAGHTHEVAAPVTSGAVRLDMDDPSHNSVRLEFNAAAMRVTGKGESADDVPKVTETMLSEMVLDVIKQTDFGITPISVGGVVNVKNELNITFTMAARER